MSQARDFVLYEEDFLGKWTPTAGTAYNGWNVTDTSSAGTPVYATLDGEHGGAIKLGFDNTSEVQNVCLSHGDILSFDVDLLVEFGWRVRMGQAAVNAATSFAVGMASARNDAIDSIAAQLLFRVIGGDSTTAIVVESDDTVTDNDDKATGTTLVAAYKWLTVNLSNKSDIRFFVDGIPVATSTTFTLAGYTSLVQPYAQLQKTAATPTDYVVLDKFYAISRRS